MNLGSKIEFNKSSLLSLKAELARKHEEASQAKAHSRSHPIKPIAKPSKSAHSSSSTNNEEEQRRSTDEDKPGTNELNLSRAALEAKAQLYDKLTQNPQSLSEEQSFLVDFSSKSKSSPQREKPSEEDEDSKRVETDSDEYDAPSDPEDDWVDYTDCLGRTRRCLRRDLADLKAQDAQLYESTKPRSPSPSAESTSTQRSSVPVGLAAPDLFSDDMRREQQRQKWEEEEERIRTKPDVHYQDVLFNEARQHGVGYFAFSTDESERRAQQAALKTLRTETVKQQASTNAARQRRSELLNKRLRAAHNRKRAKEGLPPLGDDEELPQTERPESPPPGPQPPEPEVHLASDPAKRGDRPRPTPSVRPWDIGKEGVTEKPVMTQEEWVSKKRKERPKEFAPPMFYEDRNPSSAFRNNASSSRKDIRTDEDFELPEQPKGLFFTSKKKKKFKEEPSRKPMQEVEEFTEDGDSYVSKSEERKSRPPQPLRKGAEIPPPPTMDYFGPSDAAMRASGKNSNKKSRSAVELERSITAGLSFLRQQQEERDKVPEKGLLDII